MQSSDKQMGREVYGADSLWILGKGKKAPNLPKGDFSFEMAPSTYCGHAGKVAFLGEEMKAVSGMWFLDPIGTPRTRGMMFGNPLQV